ncbi:MAG: hypothetical protein ACYCV7_05365 [Acidimicrobiales bacterium]
MTAPEFPAVELGYELRLTCRALNDLRCGGAAPGDLDAVEAATPWPAIVRECRSQRSMSPSTMGGALARMGRGDIFPFGPDGARAARWFDPGNDVCWLVGFTPDHDYGWLEARATKGELLPDEDDETLLEVEREELDFALRIGPGLKVLARDARQVPGESVRGFVGTILRLDVTAIEVADESGELVDLWLIEWGSCRSRRREGQMDRRRTHRVIA